MIVFRKSVQLHDGPCHGMSVIWDGSNEVRMIKCRQGYVPWPSKAGPPLIESEIYRPSVDSPSIFVWAKGTSSTAENCSAPSASEKF
jgi:hypothetical protein